MVAPGSRSLDLWARAEMCDAGVTTCEVVGAPDVTSSDADNGFEGSICVDNDVSH